MRLGVPVNESEPPERQESGKRRRRTKAVGCDTPLSPLNFAIHKTESKSASGALFSRSSV
jgi:hypothetical protein